MLKRSEATAAVASDQDFQLRIESVIYGTYFAIVPGTKIVEYTPPIPSSSSNWTTNDTANTVSFGISTPLSSMLASSILSQTEAM